MVCASQAPASATAAAPPEPEPKTAAPAMLPRKPKSSFSANCVPRTYLQWSHTIPSRAIHRTSHGGEICYYRTPNDELRYNRTLNMDFAKMTSETL
jgi:hypothetical protein